MRVYEIVTRKNVYSFTDDEYEVSWDNEWVMIFHVNYKKLMVIPKEAIEYILCYGGEDGDEERK